MSIAWDIIIIIFIYLSWSWATCWPVPVSRIQKSLQRSAMIPSASWRIVFHYPAHDIFLFKYHFLLHILRFLFCSSDNIMADVASKQQTTNLFLSTIVTRTRRHTNLMGNLCCAGEHSVRFFVKFFFFFYIVKLHSLTQSVRCKTHMKHSVTERNDT